MISPEYSSTRLVTLLSQHITIRLLRQQNAEWPTSRLTIVDSADRTPDANLDASIKN